jgi:TM2 domain-containing membrane protein YozV
LGTFRKLVFLSFFALPFINSPATASNLGHFAGEFIFVINTNVDCFQDFSNSPPQLMALRKLLPSNLYESVENKKITALLLTLFLGPFGAHRLYLGTDPLVPIIYTLTLGGGLGIVPLIDFGLLLFSKDLSQFENNNQFFMWGD